MAIDFHCEHCGKHIRTSDENAGKRGKCPQCQQSVYIPTPTEEIEILKLAPIDPEEEKRKKALLDETRKIAERIRAERDMKLPPETARKGGAAAPAMDEQYTDRRMSAQIEETVIAYAQHMAAGKLTEAQALADELKGYQELTDEVVQRMMADELPPPQLAKIPRPVLNGFFKQLRG